ncbi:MAG: hypothetical protein ACJAS0_002754 [Alcanivorax borkumensis]
MRVEREFLFGLFLQCQIRKLTVSQQLTKICKPYPTFSTCARVKNGGMASKKGEGIGKLTTRHSTVINACTEKGLGDGLLAW